MKAIHIAAALLVPLLWGLQYAVIKAGLTVLPPLFFAGLRFAVIAAILIPFVGRIRGPEIRPIFLISCFMGGVNFACAFVGLTRSPAGVAGIANQLWTPFTLMLAWPMLGEKPSARMVFGVGIALCGVALSIVDPRLKVSAIPTLFVIGSALGLAIGNVLAKKFGPFDPVKLFAWMSFFTAFQLLGLSLIVEGGQIAALQRASSSEWLAFAFTVMLGGIAAFITWFWLIGRFSMARVAPYALLQSFFAISAGVVFRHEPITPALMLGAIICVSGVALSQWPISARFRTGNGTR
ncbi:DMT family transporter [Paraburkholderia sp. Ac-20336]|uniref:DMT family transporter n=1 Tax=unclassified Paraburkholderia TaxID=2615204 RepID=UPI00197D5D83|nr:MULTISPECIES: DMT family transporter [unclassified Paraburkholderia]MBN3802125.1 DMT family transporter [Paraburkholderia sp. Ac-20336]MBN3851433.1 DMT family transporter [Paraburkholderia sp. Ac-20342]